MTKNIYLIGPMGCGKSSVGRELASLMKRPFFDSDDEVVQQSGVDIDWIFNKEGEHGFRQREEKVIAQLCQTTFNVVATGGGSVLSQRNQQALQRSGLIIHLRVSPQEQLRRTQLRPLKRPLLTTTNPQFLISLNQQRNPIYTKLANATFDTDQQQPKVVAKSIMRWIQSAGY